MDIKAEALQAAIRELFYWQNGSNPSNFTALLYTLFSKADPENRTRLASAFPAEARAFALWQAGDPKIFFESWGMFSNIKL